MREAHAHGRNSWGSVTRQWILNADITARMKTQLFGVGKRLTAAPWVWVSSFGSWQPTQACRGHVRFTFTCAFLQNGASLSCPLLGTGQACDQDWNWFPALGTWGYPWCHPGAESVTHLSLLTPVSSVAFHSLLYFFMDCHPVPGPTAEAAPWDGSGDLRDPQQASLWTFCRDEGFTEAQGQSPILLGSGEANRNQRLLTNCLPPAKESNQVSGFFQPKDPFLPSSLWLFYLGTSPSLHLLCWSV